MKDTAIIARKYQALSDRLDEASGTQPVSGRRADTALPVDRNGDRRANQLRVGYLSMGLPLLIVPRPFCLDPMQSDHE